MEVACFRKGEVLYALFGDQTSHEMKEVSKEHVCHVLFNFLPWREGRPIPCAISDEVLTSYGQGYIYESNSHVLYFVIKIL